MLQEIRGLLQDFHVDPTVKSVFLKDIKYKSESPGKVI
jgi:hypothetical protein